MGDVTRRAVVAMIVALLLPACVSTRRAPEGSYLRVVTIPSHATVVVDERLVGSGRVLAQRPIALSRGRHLVTIHARGYFPHDMTLALSPGVTTVRIALRPIPP